MLSQLSRLGVGNSLTDLQDGSQRSGYLVGSLLLTGGSKVPASDHAVVDEFVQGPPQGSFLLDLWVVVGRALRGHDDPQATAFRVERAVRTALKVMSMVDGSVRDRFLASWRGRELTELVGGLPDLGAMFQVEMPSPDDVLSPREQELLRRLVAGQSLEEMAGGLNEPVEQVEGDLARLFEKTGARGSRDVTERAVREGIA